jgi:hypothetical protein
VPAEALTDWISPYIAISLASVSPPCGEAADAAAGAVAGAVAGADFAASDAFDASVWAKTSPSASGMTATTAIEILSIFISISS